MKKKYHLLNYYIILCLVILILAISCSTVPKSDFRNYYYSQDYEDKSFDNVSLDICFPKNKYENYKGWDSSSLSIQIDFDTTFKKYFPDGIKMFSTVNKTGWIFYDTNWPDWPILYDSVSTDGKYVYSISPPDSLTFFQRQSDSDFLLLVQYMTFAGNKMADNKYESIITINYSLLNNTNLDVVAIDELTTRMSFNKLGNKWPFRGVILKLASEIFDRLPMFSK